MDTIYDTPLTDEEIEEVNNKIDEEEADKYLKLIKSRRQQTTERSMKQLEEATSTIRDTIVEKIDNLPVRMEFMGEYFEFLPVKVNGDLTPAFQDVVPADFARNMAKMAPKSYKIIGPAKEPISRTKPNKYKIPPRVATKLHVVEVEDEDDGTLGDPTKLLPVAEQKKIATQQKAIGKTHGIPVKKKGAMVLPVSDEVTEADIVEA